MFFLLSYLGSCHPEFPFVFIRKVSSMLIVFFLMLFKGLWLVPYSRGVPVVLC